MKTFPFGLFLMGHISVFQLNDPKSMNFFYNFRIFPISCEKWLWRGEGGQKFQKSGYVVCAWPLKGKQSNFWTQIAQFQYFIALWVSGHNWQRLILWSCLYLVVKKRKSKEVYKSLAWLVCGQRERPNFYWFHRSISNLGFRAQASSVIPRFSCFDCSNETQESYW